EDYALMDTDWRIYAFSSLYEPPLSANCEGFRFTPKLKTVYRQTLHVVWYSQENGGVGGMVELLSEGSHSYMRHVSSENEAVERFHYLMSCGNGYVYSSTYRACVVISLTTDD